MPPQTMPTFFLSYSHVDSSNHLRRFFTDLQDQIRKRSQGLPPTLQIGLFDKRMALAQDWDTALSEGLSKRNALVVVVSPRYFDSSNCGKEVAVFARRHKMASLDNGGSLRDVTNILLVRWYDPDAYESNGVADAYLHPTMRKVNWMLPESEQSGRINAIKKYTQRGMQLCVKPGKDFYEELLRAFADAIRNMPHLPEADFPVAWNHINNAFETEWNDLNRDPPNAAQGQPPSTPVVPEGVACAALFYLTPCPLTLDPRAVSFADALIVQDNSLPVGTTAGLLPMAIKAAQQAAWDQRIRDFHCACEPQIPPDSARLIDQLAALTARNVRTALVVDEDLLAIDASTRALVLRQVLESDRWHGPLVIVSTKTDLPSTALWPFVGNLQRTVALLPHQKDEMVSAWLSIFVQERSRIVHHGASRAGTDTEPPPLLGGPRSQ